MEFTEVVKKRFMCREYENKDISEDALNKILDLVAAHFPSAGHTQPQEFIVVRSQEMKDALGEAAFGQMYLAKAPVVIVVASDTRRSAQRYAERGRSFYSIVDGAFAAMLILLSAVNENLGAGFVGAFDDEEVQKVLGLPKVVRPIGIIPIGYCAEKPTKLERRLKKDIVHYEKWGEKL